MVTFPVILTGTGERARFQNEVPDRGDGGDLVEDGGPRTAGGGSEASVIGEVAAERREGRCDAEHRNDGVGGEGGCAEGDGVDAAERHEERSDAEHRDGGRVGRGSRAVRRATACTPRSGTRSVPTRSVATRGRGAGEPGCAEGDGVHAAEQPKRSDAEASRRGGRGAGGAGLCGGRRRARRGAARGAFRRGASQRGGAVRGSRAVRRATACTPRASRERFDAERRNEGVGVQGEPGCAEGDGVLAAERHEERFDAERRNEGVGVQGEPGCAEGDGVHAAERHVGRCDAEHRNKGVGRESGSA